MFALTLEGGQRPQKMLRPAPRTGLDCSGGGAWLLWYQTVWDSFWNVLTHPKITFFFEQSRSSRWSARWILGKDFSLVFFFCSPKFNLCCHFPVENGCPLMFFFIFIKSTRLLFFFFCIFVDFVEYLCDYCFMFVRNDYYFSFCCGRGLALTEMGCIWWVKTGRFFKCNILWLTGYGWHTRDANESALSDWSVNVTEAATCLSVVYPPWALLGNHASPVLYWGVGPGGGLVVFRVCTECKGCGSPVWYTASHTEILYIYIFFFTLTLFFFFLFVRLLKFKRSLFKLFRVYLNNSE